jgi:4-carboxymuconolactone decarboxylase
MQWQAYSGERRTGAIMRNQAHERAGEGASMSSRYEDGMQVRAEVLGAEHVARAQANTTEFDADFQHFITETAWGSLWTRPDLDRRTRSLITIALLAALGREHELKLHLRASRNTGASPREIADALLHVAVYAGIPAANSAMALAKAEFATPSANTSAPAEPA